MTAKKPELKSVCDHCDDSENTDTGTRGFFSTTGALKSLTTVSGMLLAVGFIGSFSLPEGWSTLFYLLSIWTGGVFVLVGAVRLMKLDSVDEAQINEFIRRNKNKSPEPVAI